MWLHREYALHGVCFRHCLFQILMDEVYCNRPCDILLTARGPDMKRTACQNKQNGIACYLLFIDVRPWNNPRVEPSLM